MTKQEIEAIVSEMVSRGMAFVEDDWAEMDNGDEYYNPLVDRENAEAILRDLLANFSVDGVK